MDNNDAVKPKKDRPKIMLATRRRRLGSMPSRFPHTDEELRNEVLKRNARASNSFNLPELRHQERVYFDRHPLESLENAGINDETEARCHSPDLNDEVELNKGLSENTGDENIFQDLNLRGRRFSDISPSSSALDVKLLENDARCYSPGPRINIHGRANKKTTAKIYNNKKQVNFNTVKPQWLEHVWLVYRG